MPSPLADARRYRAELDRLQERVAGTRRLHELQQAGAPLSELLLDIGATARRVASTVGRGQYRLGPATTHLAHLDRLREVFSFQAVDLLIHGVIGQVLTERLESRLSPHVWSYRRGRSSWQAVRQFAALIRKQRRERPDPKTRGWYVLRLDIQRYIENVPLDGKSPLWPELRALWGDDDGWALVEEAARPVVIDADGATSMRRRGLPMGSPVANPLLNLYLAPLDAALDELGGHYARFGDDLLFAHEDASVATHALERVEEVLAERGLQVSRAKQRQCYLNVAGRGDGRWRGAPAVTFLGAAVGADGSVRLSHKKWRELLVDLRARVERSSRLLRPLDEEAQAATLCAVVNETLDRRSELANAHAPLLGGLVTDRRQLAELDGWIARLVAQAATGQHSVRALRTLPPRRLRALGLVSLVARRNRGYP